MQIEFEWDEAKASSNLRKHAVAFEQACSVFGDPNILSIVDVEHSEEEERWISIGMAYNEVPLTIAYVWSGAVQDRLKVRIISARKSTKEEIRYYQGEA